MSPSDANVLISVLDRGMGVEPHVVDLIFERFYRSERARAPGVGMGLTVCRRLVEALGGHIWAEPRDGGGLAVSFTLPVWRDEPEDQREVGARANDVTRGPS